MSLAISVEHVSKLYNRGEINRKMLLDNVVTWAKSNFGASKEDDVDLDSKDSFWALRDVSFDVKQGETVGIIGSNGAGKSTLLKILSRVTTPTKGRARVQGRMASLLEVGTGFHPELTGRDNIFLNGSILGMTHEEVRAKFDDIISFADLHDFVDTPVKRYSSGMYVRLAFSVAAFLEPEILILDEILAVGDKEFREKCSVRIKEIVEDGCTLLLVSHDLASIRRLSSRCLWLRKGHMVEFGPTDEVVDHYETSIQKKSKKQGNPE